MAEPVGSAVIDLDALRRNFTTVRSATSVKIAAIVKANAYGHGLAPVSRTLVEAGADALGAAQLSEALELRGHEPDIPILTWIYGPGDDMAAAVRADLDISVGAPWAIDEILSASAATGETARIHIEVDTGMSRGGFAPTEVEAAGERLVRAASEGRVEIIGLWSHLARADEPACAETSAQLDRFTAIADELAEIGVAPPIRHLANSAGTLWHPDTHLDMVRPGIALYGMSPDPAVATATELGLEPVMTLTSHIVAVREAGPGTGVSYGHTETMSETMMLGTVPLGYADGVPRSASSRGPVCVNGVRSRVVGRVCMDQVIIALPEGAGVGDEVIFYGAGGPSADEWADAADTIGYEITTRLGRHVPRRYRGRLRH